MAVWRGEELRSSWMEFERVSYDLIERSWQWRTRSSHDVGWEEALWRD